MNKLSIRTNWWGKWRLTAATLCCAVCMSFVSSVPAIGADYKLQLGDVVEISIAGLPELRQRVTVQADGTIAFPLLGALPVIGLSPSELRTTIQSRLANKIYRQHAADGREVDVVIQPEEISATIAEYRPIYVTGDVTKPGELVFRPEMTVQQAVALAGGYNLAGDRLFSISVLDAPTLKEDYQLASVEFAKQWARAARLASELKGLDNIEGVEAPNTTLPPEKLSEIAAFEADTLKSRLADYRHERAFLEEAITQAADQVDVIAKQQKAEEQGAQDDTQELQRLVGLLSHGDVTGPRVIDARRALLLSSTRTLQITAELLQLKKQHGEAIRQLERFDDQRRIALLNDFQDASLAVNALRIKRESIQGKMRAISAATSRIALNDDKQPDITVVRRGQDGRTRLSVNEDFELAPGDVVEVSLQSQRTPALVAR